MRDQLGKQFLGDKEFKISFLVDKATLGTPSMNRVTGFYAVECRLGINRQELVFVHVNKNIFDQL